MNSLIPNALRLNNARFIEVRERSKKPIMNNWTTNPATKKTWDDQWLNRHIYDGGNVGLLCENGLIAIDSDNNQFSEWLIKEFDTYIEKTGSSAQGLIKVHVIIDVSPAEPNKLIINKNGVHYGELQGKGSQIVVCPSIHPCGGAYQIIKNKPVTNMTIEELMDKLKDWFGDIDFKQNKKRISEEEIKRLNDKFKLSITKIINVNDYQELNGELIGSNPVHGSETGQNFHVNLNNNCWYCFRHCVGGGPLQLIAIKHGLITCDELSKRGLSKELFEQVIGVGVKEYGLIIKDNLWRWFSSNKKTTIKAL